MPLSVHVDTRHRSGYSGPTRNQNGNALMVGIPDLFSGRSVAYGLASLGTMSSRPDFEMQFNILQNSIIERINKEIEKVNESSTENVDVFLLHSQRKLEIFSENLNNFRFFNGRNAWTIPDLQTKLDTLESARATFPAPDAARFDATLAEINAAVGNMQVPNGYTIGIPLDDGIGAIRRDGLINVTRGGAVERVTSYSQFTDATEAYDAIVAARAKLNTTYNSVLLKVESGEKLRVMTQQNLTSVSFQIESARTAAEAEKAAELIKLKEQYGRLLNSISLAFESNQAMAEYMSRSLFDPNKVDSGSVMNLFT